MKNSFVRQIFFSVVPCPAIIYVDFVGLVAQVIVEHAVLL